MKLLIASFVFISTFWSTLSLAEPGVVVAPPPIANESTFKLLTSGGPGAYNYFTYDKTLIQAKGFEQIFQQRKVDYDYFLATVAKIEKSFKTLLQEQVYDLNTGLLGVSIRSTTKLEYIEANDFLMAINRYQQARNNLETEIATLTAIADGQVPSAEDIEPDQSGLKKVPNYGQHNFAPIKAFYDERLKTIDSLLANLGYNINLPGGIIHNIKANSGKGLVLEAKLITLTPAQILEKKKKITELKLWDDEAERTIDEYTRFLQSRIYDFVKTYGKEGRYRHTNPVERQKRAEEARLITIGFWSRSYLRTIYGQPIGALGIPYQDRWFHADVITTSTEALMDLMEQPVWDADKMANIEKNYRRVLARADVRSEQIFDGNLGFIGTGENLLTWLGGQRNFAQCAQMMLRLLAADMYEERLLIEEGSLQAMKERYRQRYYGNEADEIFYRKAQMAYDKGVTANDILEIYRERGQEELGKKIVGEDADAFGQAGLGSGQNLRAKYTSVINHMETKNEELALAEEIEASIANALNPNNKFRAATDLRKKRL